MELIELIKNNLDGDEGTFKKVACVTTRQKERDKKCIKQ